MLNRNYSFNKGHGFVIGKSTLMQLLSHYNNIYNMLTEGKRLNILFLDNDKASKKIYHGILLQKIKIHMISGKIGKWIKEFVTVKKFRIVSIECMLEGNLESQVPQGTFITVVSFVIVISEQCSNESFSMVNQTKYVYCLIVRG